MHVDAARLPAPQYEDPPDDEWVRAFIQLLLSWARIARPWRHWADCNVVIACDCVFCRHNISTVVQASDSDTQPYDDGYGAYFDDEGYLSDPPDASEFSEEEYGFDIFGPQGFY
jgi:hypothetical protein